MSGELAVMTVKFKGDLNDLKSDLQGAKQLVADFDQEIAQASHDLQVLANIKLGKISSALRKAADDGASVGSAAKKASKDASDLGSKGKQAGEAVSSGASKGKRELLGLGQQGKKAGTDVESGAKKAASSTKKLGDDASSTASKWSSATSQIKSGLASIASKAREASGGVLSAFRGMTGGLLDFGAKARATGGVVLSSFRGMTVGLLDFGSKLGMTVIGLKGLVSGALSLGNAFFATNADLEQAKISFAAFVGHGPQLDSLIAKLQDFAATTPFAFPEVEDSALKLLNMGVKTKDLTRWMSNLGAAVAKVGGNGEKFKEVSDIIQQMGVKGHVTYEEMMQLTERNIPAFKILAQAMHLPVETVMDMASANELGADKIELLVKAMGKFGGNAMVEQGMSLKGMLSTVQDTASQLWAQFSKPLFDRAKVGLAGFLEKLSDPALASFATGAGETVARVFDDIGGAARAAWPYLRIIGQVVGIIGREVVDNLRPAARAFKDMFSPLRGLASGLGHLGDAEPFTQFMGGISRALEPLIGLSKMIGDTLTNVFTHIDLGQALPTLQRLAEMAGGLLSQKLDFLGKTAIQVGDWFMQNMLPKIEKLAPKFFELGQKVEDLVETALPPLIDTAEQLLPPLMDLAGSIMDFLLPALDDLKPLLQDAGAILTNVVAPALGALIEGTSKAVDWLKLMNDRINNVTESLDDLGEKSKKSMNQLAGEQEGKKRIGVLEKQKQQILKLLEQTTDEETRKRLKAQLKAIEIAETQAKKVLDAGQKEKDQKKKTLDEMEVDQDNMYLNTLSSIGKWKDDMLGKVHLFVTGVPLVLGQLKDRAVAKFNELKDASQAKVRELVGVVGQKATELRDGFVRRVRELRDQLVGIFTSLPGRAREWGRNLLQGFIDGIRQKWEDLKNAIAGIAQTVEDWIGHHSPTRKGPGRSSDQWGPNLVDMFAGGIRAGKPKVAQALQGLYTLPAPSSFEGGVPTRRSGQGSSGGGGQAPQIVHLHVYLDSREIATYSADATANLVVKKILQQGPVKKAS